jgi:hypothetical protein
MFSFLSFFVVPVPLEALYPSLPPVTTSIIFINRYTLVLGVMPKCRSRIHLFSDTKNSL